MQGMITERNWREVEKTFAGAHAVYRHLSRKPQTFLELLGLCHSFDSAGSPFAHRKTSRRRKH